MSQEPTAIRFDTGLQERQLIPSEGQSCCGISTSLFGFRLLPTEELAPNPLELDEDPPKRLLPPDAAVLPKPEPVVLCPKGDDVVVPKPPNEEVPVLVPPKPDVDGAPNVVDWPDPPKPVLVCVAPNGEEVAVEPNVLVVFEPNVFVFEEPNVFWFEPNPPKAMADLDEGFDCVCL